MKRIHAGLAALVIAAGILASVGLGRRCHAASGEPMPVPQVGQAGLTFFAWSDQHIKRDGKCEHLYPIIDAINALPGTDCPAPINGPAPQPAFVFGCGDNTDWPSQEAVDALTKNVMPRLKFPAFSIVGNHDEGDDASKSLIKSWVEQRYGSASYSFDCGGVHFVAVYSKSNSRQSITPKAIEFIRQDLAKIPKSRPVVIATHYCIEAISNKDEFVNSFADANVVLVMGGHLHRATVTRYRDRHFVQVPSPNVLSQFLMIRITPDRLSVLTYDYKAKQWLEKPRLDIPIAGPGRVAPSSRPSEEVDKEGGR